jgi:tetratricopeptide (TPR) repeat protein
MSRLTDGATRHVLAPGALIGVIALLATSVGCKELDGRQGNRNGNRMFREMSFIDAAAEYEDALKKVDDPIIHYNLGLTYSKIAKGADKVVRLGVATESVCAHIPGVQPIEAQVCVKAGDRRFNDCDDKNVCASSYTCTKTTLCGLESKAIAELAAQHFQTWLKANPKDTETEKLMTQVWLDSEQFEKAIAYWHAKLTTKPNDPEVMGNLAGISLKAGDWRKSIEWYTKVAEVSTDTGSKVAAYQFIGNVAWSKLNSKSLPPVESVELADLGIGALQKAGELSPKNQRLFSLQASIYNFRSLSHGASWAAAIDRASAQDLQKVSRVIALEAKKQRELEQGVAPAPATPGDPQKPAPASPPMSGQPAEKAGG